MAPSSPSVGAPLSQPDLESLSLPTTTLVKEVLSSGKEVQPQSQASLRNKDQTTTLVKEVLCAKNTVRTYGGKRKSAAPSSKSASNSPPKMRKSDRKPNKKSKSEGETKNEDQCQAKSCKLVMRKQLFIY